MWTRNFIACLEKSTIAQPSAPTSVSMSLTGMGNRRRVGSRTTFSATSRCFLPTVLSSQPPAASTFFTHSDWLL
jgi:hypothetical protein